MEAMQHLREKVEKKSEALQQHFEKKSEALHQVTEKVEEAIEEALVARRIRRTNKNPSGTTTDESSSTTSWTSSSTVTDLDVDLDISKMNVGSISEGVNENQEKSNTVYFDNNEGTTLEWSQKVDDLNAKLKDVDIQKVLSAVINGGKAQEEGNSSQMGLGADPNLQIDIVDEGDEEVIELEFERAVEKMHTHHDYNMYCPNCSSRITKVVLRRRKREKRIQGKPLDLLGCLSCFSIFIPAAGNRLNPFGIFGRGREPQIPEQQQPSDGSLAAIDSTSQQQRESDGSYSASGSRKVRGRGFNLFWIFGHRRVDENASSSQQPSEAGRGRCQQVKQSDNEALGSSGHLLHGKGTAGNIGVASISGNLLQTSPPHGSISNGNVIVDINDNLAGDVQVPSEGRPVETQTSQFTGNLTDSRRPLIATEATSSRSYGILKSIVYGGLMESITSLSVVSSAAASDATTLNIVALALANLIGGLVVLGHNLKDLRYGESNQTNEQVNKYQELLGRREHFPLHATLAVVSYLVFGLIPPVIYGFTFRESDDRDYKILAVAAASFICVVILAIGKAYTRGQHKLMEYFKTVVYYVTSAVTVSGIAYGVGDLTKILIQRLGWFDSSSPVEALLIPETTSFNPAWASY